MSIALLYNPQLIKEAAEAAGDFVWQKFPTLDKWITEEKAPSVNQLADFAKNVNVPFGYFFLRKMPEKERTVPLFRTGSGNPVFDYSFDLEETIDTIKMRQDWVSEFLKSENEESLYFVGSVTLTDSVKVVAQQIREAIFLPEYWASQMPNRDMVLRELIQKIEASGVFVVMNGVIGNNTHRPLDRNEFQGFALSDPYAPFIFLNGKDYQAAKIFTLMHELVHIWLGISAISDQDNMLPSTDKTEEFCNAVAAELLVPENELKKITKQLSGKQDMINRLASNFKVSTVVIARRLLDVGLMSRKDFFSFYKEEKKKWDNAPKNDGGTFYASQPYKVGRAFFRTVEGAVKSGKLLYTEAYRLTNLYGSTFHNFSKEMQ